MRKKEERLKLRMNETEELERYMIYTKGFSRFDQYTDKDGQIHRKPLPHLLKKNFII